jgi:transcriptional regulator with XRE-family HTH domain
MNIQQRRLEKGWSQEQLARYSGLSTRTIQRSESGQKVGLESLKCLAAVFNMSTTTLMEEQKIKEYKTEPKLELNKLEQEAIQLTKLIFKGPKKGEKDSLMKIERNAINKLKVSWKK